LIEAGEGLGIKVVDGIIIGKEKWGSWGEKG